MKALIRYPLPAPVTVPVNSLKPGDTFLRIAGTPAETQPSLWELVRINPDGTTDWRDVITPGDVITGVSGNHPVVPYPCEACPV